jgi:hypothetical protein
MVYNQRFVFMQIAQIDRIRKVCDAFLQSGTNEDLKYPGQSKSNP